MKGMINLKKKARSLFSCILVLAIILSAFPAILFNVSAAEVGIKEVYKDYFLIGTTISPNDPNNSTKYTYMKNHYNALTPENNTKPNNIWNNPTGSPSFSSTDTMVTRVKQDGYYVVGHALAWHNQSDNWPNTSWDYTRARTELQRYISTIAGHYATGTYKLDAWDVVNEAMRDNPENPTDWRRALRTGTNPAERPARWALCYGNGGNSWDYVYDAFLFAREADPDAVLIYNDFNDEELPSKTTAIASMVTELNEKYAVEHPEANGRKLIEQIGIQGHYSLRLNVDNLENTIKTYAATGCQINVTELDIQFNGTTSSIQPTAAQLKEQAKLYAKIFMLFKRYADSIYRVTFWGTSDSNSWRSSGYPLPFSGSSYTPKEAYYAIIDPEGYLGITAAPKLTSFNFGGDVFNVGSETKFDVNVPKAVSNIDFSAANVAHEYGNDVDVSVTLNPANGAVSDGKPCVATVKIALAASPDKSTTYTINFGHMSAVWEDNNDYNGSLGYNSYLKVRFSDGVTSLKLSQAFYNLGDGALAISNSKEFTPLPKHTSCTLNIRTASSIDDAYLKTLKLKKSLCNQNGAAIIPSSIRDLSAPIGIWKLAKTIESGKTYIIVSSNSGLALTNRYVATVAADGGVTTARRGLAGSAVAINGDHIVTTGSVQDNIKVLFNAMTSPDAGPYTSANGYTGYTMVALNHGGTISPFIMWRDTVTSNYNTTPLRTDTTIADTALDRAVWYNTGIDPVTGETTLFLHTGTGNYTYALHGNSSGFVAQGGTGTLEEYAAVSRVKLYEYVSTCSYDAAETELIAARDDLIAEMESDKYTDASVIAAQVVIDTVNAAITSGVSEQQKIELLAAIEGAKADLVLIISQITVTNKIIEGYAVNVGFKINGIDLARPGVSVELFGKTAKVYKQGAGFAAYFSLASSDVPAAGTYILKILDGGKVIGTADVAVIAKDNSVWTVNLSSAEDKLTLNFNTAVSFTPTTALRVNNVAKGITGISGNVVSTDVPFSEILPGTAVKISGLKLPELFPSYTFTFNVTVA